MIPQNSSYTGTVPPVETFFVPPEIAMRGPENDAPALAVEDVEPTEPTAVEFTRITGLEATRKFFSLLTQPFLAAGEPVKIPLVEKVTRQNRELSKGKLRETTTSDFWPCEIAVDPSSPYAATHVERHVSNARYRDGSAFISLAGHAPDAQIGRGSNPERPKSAPRGSNETVRRLPGFFFDLDNDDAHAHANTSATGTLRGYGEADVRALVAAVPFPVAAVVHSGNGWYILALYEAAKSLEEDREYRLRANAYVADFAAARGLHHEGAVTLNTNSVFRLVGSTNPKTEPAKETALLYADPSAFVTEQHLAALPEIQASDLDAYVRANTDGKAEDETTPWSVFDRAPQAMLDLLAVLGTRIDRTQSPARLFPRNVGRDESGRLVTLEERTRDAGTLLENARDGKLRVRFHTDSMNGPLGTRTDPAGQPYSLTASDLLAGMLPPDPATGLPDRGLTIRLIVRRGPEVANILAAASGKTHAELREEYPSREERLAADVSPFTPSERQLIADFNAAAGAASFVLDQLGFEPLGSESRIDAAGVRYAVDVRGRVIVGGDGDDRELKPFEILQEQLGNRPALEVVQGAA